MNNKIKTIGAALLTAAMCASFTGCDNRSELEKEFDKAAHELEKEYNNYQNSSKAAASSSKPNPKPLDPFDGIEVTFEGIAPLVTAKIKGGNTSVKYTLNKDNGLKNDDKVTVTAELNAREKDNYTLTSSSKEFTVSDRPFYIMKISDLSDEDIQTLSKKITDMLPDEAVRFGGEGSKVNKVDLLGNINMIKDDRNYRLYFVYKENVTFAKTNETKDYIFAAYYGHIYKEKDGTLTFSDGKPSYASTGDLSVKVNGHYVGGSYSSIDSLNSQLSGFGAERESNVKEPSSD